MTKPHPPARELLDPDREAALERFYIETFREGYRGRDENGERWFVRRAVYRVMGGVPDECIVVSESEPETISEADVIELAINSRDWPPAKKLWDRLARLAAVDEYGDSFGGHSSVVH